MVDQGEGGLVDAWINRPKRRGRAPRPPSQAAPAASPARFQADLNPTPAPTPPARSQPVSVTPVQLPLLSPTQGHPPQLALDAVASRHPVRAVTNRGARSTRFPYLIATFIALVTAAGFATWKSWMTAPRVLLPDYTTSTYAMGNVSAASNVFTQHCCPIPQNCTQSVRSSLQKALVSGRDAKSAVDFAITAIGGIMAPVRAGRHEMSCSQARSYVSKISYTANMSVSAADHFADALGYTEGAQELLDTAISYTLGARKDLHTHRKHQLTGVWRQVQETFGLADDISTTGALEQYNVQTTTVNILYNVRNLTAPAVGLLEAQEAIWRSVTADLQSLAAELHSKVTVAKRMTETCVDSDAYHSLARDVETVINKVIVEGG